MKPLCSLISILAIGLFSAAYGLTPKLPPPQQSPYQSCVKVSQGGRSFNQTSYSFFNGCGERLYINACVTDRFGDPKLYRSGRSIQVGGRFTINTLPGMSPDQLLWVAGPMDPGVPPLCGKKIG